ncbi:MAG: polyprenyl synthetase family protein [Thermodesulfobacteriota bacterium]|jgi:geranylgeranyl diphosphate synthase type II|nr:MAG: polyprenyl synthetase family protein [Thermodesulfobacteriota bacterium]
MDVESFLKERKILIDAELEKILPPEDTFPASIHMALRHSVIDGGKRIRPILTLVVNELVGGNYQTLIPFACGIELIHAYSLIHDDLPAMDNSDFRRGKPSCHKAFGETIALLAGDALLTLAFQVMTDPVLYETHHPLSIVKAIHVIAQAAGLQGMVTGQTLDIETQGKVFDLPLLEYIHTHKTGALILAAVKAGAILGEAGEDALEAFTNYGKTIGLAFQITDDVLDVMGSTQTLGKETGLDSMQGKATYPGLLGLKESQKRIRELTQHAEQALSQFGRKAEPLKQIARYLAERTK